MRFIKTPEDAALFVRTIQEMAANPSPLPAKGKRKKKKGAGKVLLVDPKIISKGPSPDTVRLDFRHRPQCTCERCLADRAQPKRRRRNGSR
jgi:hypothetical protein